MNAAGPSTDTTAATSRPGICKLGRDLVGVVEVRGGESVPVTVGEAVVKAVDDRPFHSGDPVRLGQPSALDAVVEARKPAYHRDGYQAARTDHPPGLERQASVGTVGQVVQRPEEQHCVDRSVSDVEIPGIAFASAHTGDASSLLDVQWHRVDELDVVAVSGQPLCVHTGCAAHVQDVSRRRGKPPAQDILGAPQLQAPPPLAQPIVLLAPVVVVPDVGA